ncbi:MAG: glycoside hydrolase family 25 protein [Lishizhenia sp.]
MKYFIGLILLFSLAIGVYYSFYFTQEKSAFGVSVPKGFKSLGIDVSHHQGKIDWETVFLSEPNKDSIQFVYCKATESKSHIDKEWTRNRNWLLKHNIKNGAYHFFASKSYPIPQAKHFLSIWQKRDGDLPPVLDVETEGFSDSDLIEKMKVWLETVELNSGMRPIIYTSYHFYTSKFKEHFPKHKFWIAAYSRKPKSLEDKNIIHWQFSERGKVNGINENVDLNVSKISF